MRAAGCAWRLAGRDSAFLLCFFLCRGRDLSGVCGFIIAVVVVGVKRGQGGRSSVFVVVVVREVWDVLYCAVQWLWE